MRVKCIDSKKAYANWSDSDPEIYLTIGKHYKVLDVVETHYGEEYLIADDCGDESWFNARAFKKDK